MIQSQALGFPFSIIAPFPGKRAPFVSGLAQHPRSAAKRGAATCTAIFAGSAACPAFQAGKPLLGHLYAILAQAME